MPWFCWMNVTMQIDRERLAATFTELCEIGSPSRKEGRIAERLRAIFSDLGAESIVEDHSAPITGSECGNLIISFAGRKSNDPVFFNCHMDTVEPGISIRVVRRNDIFTSAGNTILGSDDKSGIAALIEAVRVLKAENLEHIPFELVFTTCEEIGLLGAKALDPGLIRAKMGYALDSSYFGRVIIGAPASNRLRITVHGKAAHAGLQPEKGINAITLAGRALSLCPFGRIDAESSVNFGTIQGGSASNIVPEEVVIEGEVRSHSEEKLARLTGSIEEAFEQTMESWEDTSGLVGERPWARVEVQPDFPVMRLSMDDPVVRLIEQAGHKTGIPLSYEIAGGGSDANIFNGYGLQTAILSTGMTNVHTTQEQISLQDMVDLTRLVLALLL